MFRANFARGNSVKTNPGDKPAKAWEFSLGLGGKSFGVTSGQLAGLTQPVAAYGLVVAFDDALSVAYTAGLAQEDWAAKGGLNLVGANEPRKTLWKRVARSVLPSIVNAPAISSVHRHVNMVLPFPGQHSTRVPVPCNKADGLRRDAAHGAPVAVRP